MVQKYFEHSSLNFRKENFTCKQSHAWEAFAEYTASVKELRGKNRIFGATSKTFLIIFIYTNFLYENRFHHYIWRNWREGGLQILQVISSQLMVSEIKILWF